AIGLLEQSIGDLREISKDRFRNNLSVWKFVLICHQASGWAADARGFWDKGELIKALDCYRRIAKLQNDAITLARDSNLDPVYERIAGGNYIGMMGNASSVL